MEPYEALWSLMEHMEPYGDLWNMMEPHVALWELVWSPYGAFCRYLLTWKSKLEARKGRGRGRKSHSPWERDFEPRVVQLSDSFFFDGDL